MKLPDKRKLAKDAIAEIRHASEITLRPICNAETNLEQLIRVNYVVYMLRDAVARLEIYAENEEKEQQNSPTPGGDGK